MNNMQEIITKAVINKFKKNINEEYKIDISESIDNILGCWVINHTFEGFISNKSLEINGIYDINIWYSYNNNTKTNVMVKSVKYNNIINLNTTVNNGEAIIKCLSGPSVVDAKIENKEIILKIDTTMGVEIIGDKTIKVNISNISDEYEEVFDDTVNEDYLK